ncbi:MAG: hypothetical protein AB1489_01770 [Acidobacteriota bacterium]
MDPHYTNFETTRGIENNIGSANVQEIILTMPPNILKDMVSAAVMRMDMAQRITFLKDFLSTLNKAGINVNSYLLILGIDTKRVQDITPNDFGHLIRYLRLNHAHKFSAVTQVMQRYPEIVSTFGSYKTRDRLTA